MEIQSRPELAFDEQQHLYTLGGLVLPSVTQIMSPMSSMLYAAVPQAALDAAADRGTRAHEQVSNYVRYGVLETDEDTAPCQTERNDSGHDRGGRRRCGMILLC